MDWKKCMIEDLRKYESMKLSLQSIKKRIAALEEQTSSLKGARIGGEPVKGGTSYYEDRLISNIAERERLGFNFEAVEKLVGCMDAALAVLSPKERRVLELFYIQCRKGHVEQVMEELHVERSEAYRMKDAALKKLTFAMYGILDL